MPRSLVAALPSLKTFVDAARGYDPSDTGYSVPEGEDGSFMSWSKDSSPPEDILMYAKENAAAFKDIESGLSEDLLVFGGDGRGAFVQRMLHLAKKTSLLLPPVSSPRLGMMTLLSLVSGQRASRAVIL